MSRKHSRSSIPSCPLCVVVANWHQLLIISPLICCPLAQSGQQVSCVASASLRQPIPQRPLSPQGKSCGVIFIGGFGDEISGIVPNLLRCLPPLTLSETRAYYHWHAGSPQSPNTGAKILASHIAAFREKSPQADIVLIAHSMGASMALKVAALLNREDGRVFLVTLDPSDRSHTPIRPDSVFWWGNAYVTHSQSRHDYIAQLGGRWNACNGADTNICFDGRQVDENNRPYIHDNAISLIMSRRRGKHPSLTDLLRLHIRKEGAGNPEGARSTPKWQEEPRDTM